MRIDALGFLVLVCSLSSGTGWSADETFKDSKQSSAKSDGGGVKIDYSEESEEINNLVDESAYFKPFEQILQNPALLTSISGGADALNRSVESLMDSLFYSVLDNEQNFYINDNVWFNTALKRDVYSTTQGSFVVVDRLNLGPRYSKELWRIHNVPISLGIDGSVEVLQIYLRNDGMRLAEQKDLPTWRRWVNNWFGIVPGLAKILPPSFNQNELYDPLRLVETPFAFPLDAEGIYTMPIGSIRSYALSGGVQLSVDLGGGIDKSSRDLLYKIGALDETLPYAVFRRGEHRINVLRRSEHKVWVGVKELRRVGHLVSPLLGKKYAVLKGALAATIFSWHWIWPGVPIGAFPVSLTFEQAFADLYDQVYEYDLRNIEARQAYEAAVKGDFVPSRSRWLDSVEKKRDTGVVFQFTRAQLRKEELFHNGPNIAVYRRERQAGRDSGEIEITDPDGKFHVLEATRDVTDKRWDILVGEQETRVQEAVSMKVRKVVSKEHPDDPTDYTFVFEADPDPIGLQATLGIHDGYTDVSEYRKYVDDVRYFTELPIAEAPSIPVRDAELERQRRRQGFFANPHENIMLLHVPATYLGAFGAQAIVHFTTPVLDAILARPLDDKWEAYAKAYGVDAESWKDPMQRQTFLHKSSWFKAFFMYPFRLFNWRFPTADAIKDATDGIARMDEIKALQTPREKLDGFYRLLDTAHPERLVKVLLLLSDANQVSRKVTFSAQPKGAARAEIKHTFETLNGMHFSGGPALPLPTRYARAKKKLANFYLDQPRDAEDKPKISQVLVTTRTVPASVRALVRTDEESEGDAADAPSAILHDESHVFFSVAIQRIDPKVPLKLYVRVEQAGKLKLGKLELAEKVLELTPSDASPSGRLNAATFDFFLTGPLSPLTGFMFDKAMSDGDELLVTLAASRDGTIWSEQRVAEFRFEHGRLEPIK